MWTEAAIAKQLDGKFYRLEQKSLGSFTVIDLNEIDEEPAPVPAPVVAKEPELEPIIRRRHDGGLWLEDITKAVCIEFGVTKLELESIRRNHKLVAARQVLFWLAKKYTAHTFPFIGAWCGRDHTTVLYAVDKIDRRFRDYCDPITRCLSRLGVSLNEEKAA